MHLCNNQFLVLLMFQKLFYLLVMLSSKTLVYIPGKSLYSLCYLQVQLLIYFMLKYAMEILLSESSVISSYYFGWTTSEVSIFLASLGLTVLPINIVVGSYISNMYEDRYFLISNINGTSKASVHYIVHTCLTAQSHFYASTCDLEPNVLIFIPIDLLAGKYYWHLKLWSFWVYFLVSSLLSHIPCHNMSVQGSSCL